MERDSFDELLNSRLTEDEWQGFATILEISKFPADLYKRRLLINKEFRRFYGNTVSNLFRNEFEPDYEQPILEDALKVVDITDKELNDCTKTFEGMSQNEIVLRKEDIIFHKVEGCFKEKQKRSFSNDIDSFVNDLIVGVDSYYGVLKKVKKTGLTLVKGGGVAGAAAKIFGPVTATTYMAGTAVNEMFFETNWKKVLEVIMFSYVVRKRMYIEDRLNF